MRISTFFEKTLGAKLANPRWSWGATNPTTHRLFLRVWADNLETVNGIERISIHGTKWKGGSAGLPERQRHVESLRNGTEGYGVLCTPKDGPTSSSRSIADFDEQTLLKFGELIEEGDRIYARVIDRIPVGQVARHKTSHSSLLPDLKSILGKGSNATTKETLANARVGQGAFRDHVLQMWDSQCCVTGSRTLDAIRASHIKPWRDSTDDERLDPCNGLPLIATLDALFDAGLITFADDGELIVSKRVNSKERKRLGLSGQQLSRIPKEKTAEFLCYHRKSIFVDT